VLVEGLRRGDERSFLELLQRHQGVMLRLARTHVPSDATAEDVVQETWLAILRGIDGFDERSSLKTWMYRILMNRAKTMGGQRGRRSTPDTVAVHRELDRSEPAVSADRFLDGGSWPGHWKQPPLSWERPASGEASSTLTRVVVEAISSLAPAQRLVVTLRDVEHWSAADVCDVLDLSETTQRVLLHRARSKVRQRIEDHFRAGGIQPDHDDRHR
jgi:RNA polymerase sigma-70 factor (ECF subfamily)